MYQFSLLSSYVVSALQHDKYIDVGAVTYLSLYQTYLLYTQEKTIYTKQFIIIFTFVVYAIAHSNIDLWLSLYPFFPIQSFIISNI